MPRFKSSEGQQAFREAVGAVVEWRKEVVADLIEAVIPTSEEDGIPKRLLARMAAEHYHDDKQRVRADAGFNGHSDFFVSPTYILNNWADIRAIFAERRLAICMARTETGQIVGVFASRRKVDIENTHQFKQRIIEGSVERHNTEAEWLNRIRYVQLPLVTMNLLGRPGAS